MHVNEKENDKKKLHKNQIRQRDVKTLLFYEMGTLHGRCLQIIKIMDIQQKLIIK